VSAISSRDEWRAGWPVVIAAAIGVGVGLSSLWTFSFGVLVKPMIATLGWTRGQATGSHLCIALATMLGAPLVGVAVDRFGPRRVALWGIPVAALGYASLATIGRGLIAFYALSFVVGVLAVATGPIVWTRVVSGWFTINRGFALACTLVGTGLFALLGPPAVTWLVARAGWREAFVALAALMASSWISTYFWLRERPLSSSLATSMAFGLTLRQALRARRFWVIAAGLLLASVGSTAMVAHLVPMLTDRGVSPKGAAWVLSTLGLAVVTGRLLAGRCLDRFPTGWVCAVLMVGAACGCALMLNFDGVHLEIPVAAAILVGLAAGGEIDLIAFLAAKYFGLSAYGRIAGVLYACFALGAGSAPVLAGVLFDRYGNYQRALEVVAVAFAASAVLLGSLGGHVSRAARGAVEAGAPPA
jgi:predicted MFS family arabinose efflux permease